jgi:hypothetical protein
MRTSLIRYKIKGFQPLPIQNKTKTNKKLKTLNQVCKDDMLTSSPLSWRTTHLARQQGRRKKEKV